VLLAGKGFIRPGNGLIQIDYFLVFQKFSKVLIGHSGLFSSEAFSVFSFQSCLSHFCNLHFGNSQSDVLLVFHGKHNAPDPQVPLALLHIAASLKQEGFTVRLLDMRLEDYHQFQVGNPVFVGISCMSGLQIKYALEFARYVRIAKSFLPTCLGRSSPNIVA
jgi:hypothetical protein